MPGPVVVGVDGTAAAHAAVRWAAAHAQRHGTGLRLVHALEPWKQDSAHPLDMPTVAGLPVTVVEDDLSAAELLVRESTGASLVVLGARGAGGYFGQLVGATAAALACRGRCPLVVTGHGGEPSEGQVVVGMDGTPTSEAAVEFAFREAASLGTRLLAVHGSVGSDPEAAELTALWLESSHKLWPEVEVAHEIVPETPGRALLDRAADARLVVVGSRRRIGHRGMALRSTSHYLLHRATCPVAVVRRDHII